MDETLNLDEIEARAKAATPGPWNTNGDAELLNIQDGEWYWMDVTQADAAFIAAAREDIPALVEEVRRLTNENTAQAKEIERLNNTVYSASETLRKIADGISLKDAAGILNAPALVAQMYAVIDYLRSHLKGGKP